MALRGGHRSVATWLAVALLVGCGAPARPSTSPLTPSPGAGEAPASANAAGPVATQPPPPGHELYGFVPYWEMDGTIAAHVAATPLTTVALFSVTDTPKGTLDTSKTGYRRITGSVGAAIIAAAHRRQARVDVVWSSFGASRNSAFFGSAARQARTVDALVALVGSLGVDGIDIDVEGLDLGLVAPYGQFVGRLRSALVAAHPGSTVTVATPAGPTGAAMAAAAVAAGADRVFLMGYDYRGKTSSPGATAPLDRADGGRSLTWSLDLYGAAGIPPGRLLLGLPLYGVAWPVAGPVIGAPATGAGATWILRQHLDVLRDPAAVAQVDPLEGVSVYFLGSDGSLGPPSAAQSGPAAPRGVTWSAVYVDSPATLAAKLALGQSRGLAGAGFWAIGYERGLEDYTALMRRYVAAELPTP